jgi:WD40 repeat protein
MLRSVRWRIIAVLMAALFAEVRLPAADAPWSVEPVVWTIPVAGETPVISALALHSDGSRLAVGFDTGKLIELDAKDGSVLRQWPAHQHRLTAVCYQQQLAGIVTADDQGMILTSGESKDDGKDSVSIILNGDATWVTSLAVSSTGAFASAGYDRTVKLWNFQANSAMSTALVAHQAAVKAIDFSPDGTQLVSGSADRTAIIWNLKTKEPRHTIQGHAGSVRDVKFAPNGKQIATAAEDGGVRLWNVETGERQKSLAGHAGMVWRLAYSPDGRWLASGGFDQTVRLWNPKTGERQAVLRGAETPIVGLAFAPDSRTLYVTSQDRTLRRYSAEETKP